MTVQRGQSLSKPTERALQAVLAKAEDDFGSDDEFEQAENDARSSRTVNPEFTPEQRQVIDRLLEGRGRS